MIHDDRQARHVERALEEALEKPRHRLNDRSHPVHGAANRAFHRVQDALFQYRRKRWGGQAQEPGDRR